MKIGLSFLLVIACFLVHSAGEVRGADTAIVEGRITLKPAAKRRTTPARYRGAGAKTEKPDPPMAVVYLEGAAGPSRTGETTEVRQVATQFKPALIPVQVGAKVTFPNADDFYHNVFSYSRTKRFDLGRYLKGENPPAVQFDKPGEVKVYCEIHRHMRASILVLETPHFTKTDAEGNFRLEKLPVGRYTLKAWLDSKTIYQAIIELKAGQNLKVDLPSS